jgi:hypothetical protein
LHQFGASEIRFLAAQAALEINAERLAAFYGEAVDA